MTENEFLGALMLKLTGAVIGTVLALIFKPPRSRKDFQRRAIFCVLAGVVLTPIAMLLLGKVFELADNAETIVAVASITAFGSWWAAGAFLRAMRAADIFKTD